MEKISQANIAQLLNYIVSDSVTDCLINMYTKIALIAEKKERLSIIEKFFDEDAAEEDVKKFNTLISDFINPNFQFREYFW